MTLVGDPLIGIVYKTSDNTRTYTSWYHEAQNSYYPFRQSPSIWLSERLNLNDTFRKNNIQTDRIMCIVRAA